MNTSTFKNIKIIDLSTVLAGPSVGSFFAELGADVLKIENPQHPDITRSWKLKNEAEETPISAYFSGINYKKNYAEIDYKQEKGRQELLKIIQSADVVLMNFKAGLQERLGIEDTVLRKENPHLIIGKINGFGDGNSRVAYDLILQAESGFMSMNGTSESGPVKMPVALIDVLAGHHLKEGILIELLKKSEQKNYKGKTISVSLYDAAVSSLVNQASNYLMANHVPQRIGSLHPNIAPYGELFQTKDDKTVTFAIGSNAHFKKMCAFFEIEEISENKKFKSVQKRVQNRSELYEILNPIVKKYLTDAILKEMQKRDIPCGEIKDLKAVFSTKRAQDLIRKESINGIKTQRVSSIAFQKQ